MANLFRSEDMSFCELIVESEVAYNCVAALSELSRVQFLNMNENSLGYKLRFAADVRRCNEMEQQIGHIETAIEKNGIQLSHDFFSEDKVLTRKELIKLQTTLDECETQLNEDVANIAALKDNHADLLQFQGVIEMFERYFEIPLLEVDSDETSPYTASFASQLNQLSPTDDQQFTSSRLDYLAGVLPGNKAASFERMLWRIGRGNIFVRTTGMKDQQSDKQSFMAFFHGASLKAKIEQVCQAYHAKTYPCPLKADDRLRILEKISHRRQDIAEILEQAIGHCNNLMSKAAKMCRQWKVQVRKVQTVYEALNFLQVDVTNKYLIGQCWVPTATFSRVEIAIRDVVSSSEQYVFNKLPMPRSGSVPTYFRSNKLSKSFQNIVHSYSVAKYKEVNPALFTIITFPFLFAVMFGDFGHGVIMTCFGAWMCIKEKNLKKHAANSESFGMIFGGRYTILLMGLFSIYAGILYNECFAKTFNIFGSSWQTNYTEPQLLRFDKIQLNPNDSSVLNKWPYPIGCDPTWETADNRINFINSLKMKLSIIFGVAQMLFGICLSLFNHLYFKNWINIFSEFIPQMLFICCLFVYMDALVVFKWVYFSAENVNSAPSILITMINMCLFKYSEETPYDEFVYHNLRILQHFLFIFAILTIPWMLFVKPLFLQERASARQRQGAFDRTHLLLREDDPFSIVDDIEQGQFGRNGSIELNEMNNERNNSGSVAEVISQLAHQSTAAVADEQPLEQFDIAEVFIHQAIHTIEYVLGLISHTASYLRLWALSLAHSELSNVLWTMVFRRALSMATDSYVGVVAIFIIFLPWACLTIAILVMMEGMSAFLHALRLHWVEFQSKFYEGGGTLFQPLNFKTAYAKK